MRSTYPAEAGRGPACTVVGSHPRTGLPVRLSTDRTLRLKVIDACGMTCTFCHNEGTPVVADNLGRAPGEMTGAGRSGRVSIYLGTNGARFLPATVAPDESLASTLDVLRDALHVSELHLTGGEPTLHPRLSEVVAIGVRAGYQVCATSNGENGARALRACGEAGLERVNFSIFGTTAEELAQVQHGKYANTERAERKIRALQDSIRVAIANGIGASANIVVPDATHVPRVHRLLTEYLPGISVRLLNSLDDGDKSIDAIHELLVELKARPIGIDVTAGASGWRTAYRLPSGRVVFFKQIRPVRLPETCAGCRFNNGTDCEEGYYGVRLYRDRVGTFQVGVCIQRMDLCLPVEEFVRSDLREEILALRETEFQKLAAKYGAEGV
ncbi:cyclic pyranopterin phosphate synthase [Kribbella pratensis]|uniref:Cyclic pyranopterin phosphate synthase n=1 Tax=Kribbella pratensis TaxID=2512112 RepID=A0ABY2F8I3_9ACTN|nr:radical SAM protein [Kribbella pratensis]TDW84530.1 cyclic pyranopterin phosphate synthase [Kribbella pratensis]